ncbi:hypothetical protein CTEN210_01222 [Chaetoceros tenuissimus]|uniref:Uncharacterized protein n=1 Tax=Chaetoceros tenuissimus TaxID=426638 RepID=A0AAD3GZP1_9STRA|nr:hypothetical protein CTEN210_01222 [Chaetoceros tenuissimus]
MTTRDDEINAAMPKVAPELASKYAAYPMKRQVWLSFNGQIDGNIPAFIPHQKDPYYPTIPLKEDYVWGTGPRGFGYYHILCREAYVILYHRISHMVAPGSCCSCFSPPPPTHAPEQPFSAKELKDVKDVIYARSVSSRPDDFFAVKEAIEAARGVAQAHYHVDQNIQLAVIAGTNLPVTSTNTVAAMPGTTMATSS